MAASVIDPQLDLQQQLVERISAMRYDPVGFVRYAYEWGERELCDTKGPYDWQLEILKQIQVHLRNSESRYQPLLISVSSGKGIGKSALVAMIINWGMSTCADCKIVITANTGTQLATKTQPEAAKWHRLAINQHWFNVNATSIRVRDAKHGDTWRADFIPWSKQNVEAFQGLHNKGKRIILIFDEASGIDDEIWKASEGALTDENTEIIWIAFSNPTRNTGRFRECFGKLAHRWQHKQIDSRSVPGTNKQQIQNWIQDYGEDSDFVRVWVKGEFPRRGSSQFISSESVELCRKFKAEGYANLPKIISVDVARFGDDETVIGMRHGRKFEIKGTYRGLDTVQVAHKVIELQEAENPDAVVIDGDGIGAGVIDQMKHRGFERRLFEFHGGEAAQDAAMYFNRRAEVWGWMRDAIQAGMEIPDEPLLAAQLTEVEYGFSNKQQIQLEKKDDMKRRGLSSPDRADSLAMSFSVKVAAPQPLKPVKYVYPGQMEQQWMS